MNRQTLPINEIHVLDRQRIDYGDLDDLVASLKSYGLIQPIIINQDRRLIAGGRRLAAAQKLGWDTIDVCYRETMSTDELHILELEENLRRKDETWMEKVLHIAHIHVLKRNTSALDGQAWGQKETGEMLGVTNAHICINLQMAEHLKAELGPDNKPLESARFWKCDTFAEAWRLRLRDYEDAELAALQAQSQLLANQPQYNEIPQDNFDFSSVIEIDVTDLARVEARERYESNPLNTVPFDQYWSEKQARVPSNTIFLSRRLFLGDSITFMNEHENLFDHVITDIPYGIDVSYLDQQNPHGGMSDIDTIADEHDVDDNKTLIAKFFPAAFKTTKEKAFVITWADQMLWQFMHDEAIKAGFRVQRWPITWVKLSPCMNQCAQYNFTKNTEIAIVCRKPGAMLREQQPGCVISAPKDDLCEQISHPFAKPEAIWSYLASAVAIPGQSILDPFAGRGSGVISMLRQGFNVTGVELQENHYNHLVENVKQLHYLRINPNFTFA